MADDPNLDLECWDALIRIWTSTGRDISFLDVPPTILQQREAMMSTSKDKPLWKKKRFFDGLECGYQNCKNPAEGYIPETTRPTKGGATLWFGPACTPCVRKWHDSLNPMPLAELARQRNGASDLAAVLDVEVGAVLKRLQAAGIDEGGRPLMPGQPIQAPQSTAIATVEHVGIPVQSLESAITEVTETLSLLSNFHVMNQAQMDLASGWLQEVKAKWSEIEEQRKHFAKPLQDRVKEVQAYFKPPLDLLSQAERILKQKIAEGAQRAQEAQQAALAAAHQALQQGDMQGVALATQAVQAADVGLSAGISMRPLVRFEIVDPGQLPPVFWSPDPAKVQGAIDAGHRVIPGVRIWEEPNIAARAS